MQFYYCSKECYMYQSHLISRKRGSHPRDEHLVSRDKRLSSKENQYCTVADPDLQIRGGGTWPSRLWDKERGPVSKIFFSALWASFWSKNKGGQASPASSLDLPLLQQFWHKLQERSNFSMTRACGSDQKRNNTLNRGPKAWNISEVLGWDFYSIEKHVPKTIHYKRANIWTSLYLPATARHTTCFKLTQHVTYITLSVTMLLIHENNMK